MELQDLDVRIVGNPPPHFGGRYFVFLRRRTVCRVEGVGEVCAATLREEPNRHENE